MERGDFYVKSALKGVPAKSEEGKEFHDESRKKGCDQITKISTPTKKERLLKLTLSYSPRHQISSQAGGNSFVNT